MTDPGGAGTGGSGTVWIETREGGLFFVNAVLFIPELVVLIPLGLGGLLGLFGAGGDSVYLDTFPILARHALPWVGWALIGPVWTTLHNLRMDLPGPARTALRAMLASHLGFLAWTAWLWVGGGGAGG